MFFPVGFVLACAQSLHDRIRVVNGLTFPDRVPVIPPLHAFKASAELFALGFDFVFYKAHVFCKSPGSSIEYSSKSEMADCEPSFLIGRMPAM